MRDQTSGAEQGSGCNSSGSQSTSERQDRYKERLTLTFALIVLTAGGVAWGAFSAEMHIPLWAVGISAGTMGALVGLRLAVESWLK